MTRAVSILAIAAVATGLAACGGGRSTADREYFLTHARNPRVLSCLRTKSTFREKGKGYAFEAGYFSGPALHRVVLCMHRQLASG